MNTASAQKIKRYNRIALILSIVIPGLVAILFRAKLVDGYDFSFLPPIYASINGLTALVLILALVAIKKGNRTLHQRLIHFALALSASFLLLYVLYHMTSESTPYGGEGWLKYFYYFLLISHILLSVTIVPFVLYTYVRAITNRLTLHKKLARITFPLWLYVAISGVVIYKMIAEYYVKS